MKQIELRRTPSGWTATMLRDGQPDPEIVGLFGTATLPTAYTAMATRDEVLRAVSNQNRDAAIWIV